jgi:hypothetical protein
MARFIHWPPDQSAKLLQLAAVVALSRAKVILTSRRQRKGGLAMCAAGIENYLRHNGLAQ